MCGILGVVCFKTPFRDSSRFFRALSAISHRGPDDSGEYFDDHVRLGHTRLSIIELSSAGHQPMSSIDGRYVVVFNGEIYNYLELRDELELLGEVFVTSSDTEVLLVAFKIWGRNCVNKFRGMFAFAIWDNLNQQLFMARDRCGEKPFFYHMDGDNFYFSSEIKSLVALVGKEQRLNPEIIDMYLHYQYVPEPFTLLKGVKKLEAGSTALLDAKGWKLQSEKYWALDLIDNNVPVPMQGDEALDAIKLSLEESVCLTLRSDVPVGIALSGGIDSGVIAAMAAKHSSAPLHAFSVGYPGRPAYDERDQAKELANSLGMIIHEVEIPIDQFVDFFPTLVSKMDEPIADPAAFGHYSVPKAAADSGIKVLLSGIGGDELFWGYGWVTKAVLRNEFLYRHHGMKALLAWLGRPGVFGFLTSLSLKPWLPNELRRAVDLLRKNALALTPENQLHVYMMAPDFPDIFSLKARIYGEAMSKIGVQNPFTPTAIKSYELRDIPLEINQIIFNTWLTSNCLSLSDRVSMASGVETRLPFLDVNLIELVVNLRLKSPDHHLGQKFLLRNALKGVLPPEVLKRPKSGFRPPVLEWISGVVGTYGDKLLSGELAAAGIINVTNIRTQLDKLDAIDWPHLFTLYKLVLLEEWVEGIFNVNR